MTRSHLSLIFSFIATVLALSLMIGCGGSGGQDTQAGAPAAADTAGAEVAQRQLTPVRKQTR